MTLTALVDKSREASLNIDAYSQGYRDCENGKEAKDNQHPDYYRGYGVAYAVAEVLSWRTSHESR